MEMKELTYLAIKDLLDKWYGLTNAHANLQVLVAITEMVNRELKEAQKQMGKEGRSAQ